MIVTFVLLVAQNGKANHMSGNKNKILWGGGIGRRTGDIKKYP